MTYQTFDALPKVNVDNPVQSGITEKVANVKIPDGLDKV
jgi:hypothetical protein